MKTESTYNLLNALIYELIIQLCRYYPLKQKKWVRMILKNCLGDWAAFRAELEIKKVDQQIDELLESWDKEAEPTHRIIEHKPDGSEAQKLLGGTLEIRGNWQRD